jgi:hypothetical protein
VARGRVKRRVSLSRLSRGEAIAAASAIALFAFTFFDWYTVSAPQGDLGHLSIFDTGGNAWHSFEVAPWLLTVVVLAAVGAAVLSLRGSEWRPAIPPSAVVAVCGGLATLLVLWRILVPPDFGAGELPLVISVQLGAYLALVAALGVAYGGYRAMGERGTSFAKIADALSKPSGAKPRRRPEPSLRSPAKSSSRTQRPSS